MATVKQQYKTPLLPLSWVNISGTGKLKMNKDSNSTNPNDYNYTATVTFPDEDSIKEHKKLFDKFWKENRPAGCTKPNYEMFKPEMVSTLDENGKEQKDEYDAIIKHHSGRYTLQAKTLTTWPDGQPNVIKVLRSNGDVLNLGTKKIGEGSTGVIHGSIAINDFTGNEGLAFYLTAIQLKKFVEYTGSDKVVAEDLGDDEGMDDLDIDASVSDIKKENLPKI